MQQAKLEEKNLAQLLEKDENKSFDRENQLLKDHLAIVQQEISNEQWKLGWFRSWFYSTPEIDAWAAHRNVLQQEMKDLRKDFKRCYFKGSNLKAWKEVSTHLE